MRLVWPRLSCLLVFCESGDHLKRSLIAKTEDQRMAIHCSADPFEIQRNPQNYRHHTMLDSLDKV
jgi:hypothetical protein